METFNVVTELPLGEECVSMIQFHDKIYIATKRRVYLLKDDVLIPMQFVEERREDGQR